MSRRRGISFRRYPPDYLRAGAPLAFALSSVRSDRQSGPGHRSPTPARPPRRPRRSASRRMRTRCASSAPHHAALVPSRCTSPGRGTSGQPDACRGTDVYRAIPIVPRRAKVGRPGSARLSGRYRVRYHGETTRAGPCIRGAMYSVAPPECSSSGGLAERFAPAAPGSTTLRVVSVSVPAPSSQTEAAALSASTATPRSRCASYAAARRTASRLDLGADVSTTRTRRATCSASVRRA